MMELTTTEITKVIPGMKLWLSQLSSYSLDGLRRPRLISFSCTVRSDPSLALETIQALTKYPPGAVGTNDVRSRSSIKLGEFILIYSVILR